MRTCTICKSPQRNAIEASIVARTSYRDIACQFGIGRMAVQRHASSHISRALQSPEQEETRSLNVLKQLVALNAITWKILEQSRKDENWKVALWAIDQILKQLSLQSRLFGDAAIDVTIAELPEWKIIKQAMMQALEPYPEVKIAVASALMQDFSASALEV